MSQEILTCRFTQLLFLSSVACSWKLPFLPHFIISNLFSTQIVSFAFDGTGFCMNSFLVLLDQLCKLHPHLFDLSNAHDRANSFLKILSLISAVFWIFSIVFCFSDLFFLTVSFWEIPLWPVLVPVLLIVFSVAPMPYLLVILSGNMNSSSVSLWMAHRAISWL